MKVSWVGMPTLEDSRKTAEAWLERKPGDINVVRDLDPSANLNIVFDMDAAGPGAVDFLGREGLRRRSVVLADSLDKAGKRAVWLAKMVSLLLFSSRAGMELFGRFYPEVATSRAVLPIVLEPVPEKQKPKRKRKGKKKKIIDDGSYEVVPLEMEEKIEPSPQEVYKKELDKSAQAFWQSMRRWAK